MPTPAEIKKALQAAGFEIYRTRADVVQIADRVRENLLMDSGVHVEAKPDDALQVGFVVRAQKTDFPNDADADLFERARKLGALAADHGYVEVSAEMRTVADPGDAARAIDRWCEVAYGKTVASPEAALDEVRFALTLEKAAAPS